jgi:hypothetical protein
MTLVEFLTARLDEDEAVARAATAREWRLTYGLDPEEFGDALLLSGPDKAHAERHDPARVLREVEAKRRIIERLADAVAPAYEPRTMQTASPEGWDLIEAADGTLKVLASIYADHPDYRDEWFIDRTWSSTP